MRAGQIICLPSALGAKSCSKMAILCVHAGCNYTGKKSGGTASFDVRSNFPFNFYIKSVIQMLIEPVFFSFKFSMIYTVYGRRVKNCFRKTTVTFNYNVFRQQKVDSLAKELWLSNLC
jgi:hypothetical protein